MPLPPVSLMGWQERAACRGAADPGRFDRLGRLPDEWAIKRTHSALKVCTECPVRPDCLAFGVRSRSSGVYGGYYLVVGSRSPVPRPLKPTKRPTAA
jgi:hypothetical protein